VVSPNPIPQTQSPWLWRREGKSLSKGKLVESSELGALQKRCLYSKIGDATEADDADGLVKEDVLNRGPFAHRQSW